MSGVRKKTAESKVGNILFEGNKNGYPTPPPLNKIMIAKIKGHPCKILEPEAGRGDLIHELGGWDKRFRLEDISAIEIDETLQNTLRGAGIKLIDTDFLAYSGPDKFDLIIGNPPFDEGDKHLMKAIEILYSGQIIFLLNAETIKNPHTNLRKDLVRKLGELGASYLTDALMGEDTENAILSFSGAYAVCVVDGNVLVMPIDRRDRTWRGGA